LIDGEGCILVKRRMPSIANRMKAPRYSLSVGIAMTDAAPVHFLAEYCGLPQLVTSRVRDGCKRIYEFEIERQRAASLLRDVLPYLIGKKTQAEQALTLADLCAESRKHRTKVVSTAEFKSGANAGRQYRLFGLSDEFVDRCEAIYQSVKRTNPRAGKAGAWGNQ
jgi:hypothetical protein